MLKNIFLLTLAIAVLSFTSCKEDDTEAVASYGILGSISVNPETTGTYTLHVPDVDATWSSSDESVMSILSTSPSTAEVAFLKSGNVTLTATDGVRTGVVNILVNDGIVGLSVFYAGTGKLKSGTSDTVFFLFDSPLNEAPIASINTDSSGFKEDSLAFVSEGAVLSGVASYNGSSKEFFAVFTAGSGDGQPEVYFPSVVLNDVYGGVEDSLYAWLPVVDNVAPVASISFSESIANDSTNVTITMTFNEVVMPNYATAADSLLKISISGAGVVDSIYSLNPTEDAKVWTLDYITNGSGDGVLSAILDGSSVQDLAGNTSEDVAGQIIIDNTAPDPSLVSYFDVMAEGSNVNVTVGSGVKWLYVDSGDAAPSLSDFEGASTESANFTLAAGTYDFYYYVSDAAGNSSEIVVEAGIIVE